MNKKQWKVFYRKIRVVRRETEKALIDMLLYGKGFVFVPDDGSDAKHIPTKDVVLINGSGDELLIKSINNE